MIDFKTISTLSFTIRFTSSYGLRGKGCRGCDRMVVGFTTQGRIQREAHPAPPPPPPPKIGKNKIFWRKIVIFHTKYPKNFRASLRNWKKYDFLA